MPARAAARCVEACPMTTPGGVTAEPVMVIDGILDLLRGGDGNEQARKWASSCVQSGDCIKACDYGVNPRFLIAMARVACVRRNRTMSRRAAARASRCFAVSAAIPTISRGCNSTTRCWSGSARNRIAPNRCRRGAGLRVLHGLQRAQDAAHGAAGARYHGPARHHL